MNDGLQRLRDIHLPEMPSWWPLAPGWWISLVLLVVLVALGVWLWRYYQQRQYSAPRVALKELDRLQGQYVRDRDAKILIIGLSALMRRVAISLYPKHEVASLNGEQWLAWLDHHSDHDKPFSQGVSKVLADAPYRQHLEEIDCDAVLQTCRQWIECQQGERSSDV